MGEEMHLRNTICSWQHLVSYLNLNFLPQFPLKCNNEDDLIISLPFSNILWLSNSFFVKICELITRATVSLVSQENIYILATCKGGGNSWVAVISVTPWYQLKGYKFIGCCSNPSTAEVILQLWTLVLKLHSLVVIMCDTHSPFLAPSFRKLPLRLNRLHWEGEKKWASEVSPGQPYII